MTNPEAETPATVESTELESTELESAVLDTTEQRVTIQRSARYPRLMLAGAIVGLIVGGILTLLFPVGKDYTLGQILGFMALVSATIGLALGALLALILDRAVRNRRGEGIALHTTTRVSDGDN